MVKREKKRERKESENYKTENGRKLVMKDERKEGRKEKKSCGVKIYIFVMNKSLISRRVWKQRLIMVLFHKHSIMFMRILCMITHKHVFVFKNCDRYDYDINLLRHKYM